jgi:hypothetical protein
VPAPVLPVVPAPVLPAAPVPGLPPIAPVLPEVPAPAAGSLLVLPEVPEVPDDELEVLGGVLPMVAVLPAVPAPLLPVAALGVELVAAPGAVVVSAAFFSQPATKTVNAAAASITLLT